MDEPAFVLVPGAGGAAWYWHRVVDRLARRGHEAIAVELPGDDPAADLPDYVDAVVAAAGSRTGLVVVAQSLGGFTGVAACARLPVSLLVFVNAMIPVLGETPGEWWAATGQREAKAEMDTSAGRPADVDFDVVTYFLHDVPPEVLADPAAGGREQSGTHSRRCCRSTPGPMSGPESSSAATTASSLPSSSRELRTNASASMPTWCRAAIWWR
jgi:pimeloyl-ACP methyl ester carboxylesterase